MTKIGKNIKKLRGVKGLTQQSFASLFNLTRGNVSSYEELRAEPRLESIIEIANYFGIPLNDFILKELSVNELVHYDSALVTEMNRIKKASKFVQIPYVGYSYLEEYVENYSNQDYLDMLPQIAIPNGAKNQLIAFEIDNSENLPAGFGYKNGDIVILEKVQKENVHRLTQKLGVMVGKGGIKIGVYSKIDEKLHLVLNELVKYPFLLESDAQYWVLRAFYSQID